MADLTNKPWGRTRGLRPTQGIYNVKGMLGDEERRALRWIGKEYYKGTGAIVDAGAFIGASAYCFAAGLSEQKTLPDRRPLIYSYDYFKVIDTYVARDIAQRVRPIGVGRDYLDIFRLQTRLFAPLIEPIAGDFLGQTWSNGPIEVLFVDVAKTQALNSHVVREFFPHLEPGRSLLIQQDFYHAFHPYIHVTMEALSDYFEVLDGHILAQSRLYRCKARIPSDVLSKVADYSFSAAERLELIDRLIALGSGDMRIMSEAVRLCQLVLDGDDAAIDQDYRAFVATHEHTQPRGLWWQNAQEIMSWIA